MAKKRRKPTPEATPPQATRVVQEVDATHRCGSSLVKTCTLFAVVLAALHAATWLFSRTGYIRWGYTTAHVVSLILNATGIHNTVGYNVIQMRNDIWYVTNECTAIYAIFLFVSFVVSYSSSVRSKALGLLAGIPTIVLANLVRLVVLGWVTEYFPRYARMFHDYIWEAVFLFFIVALWLAWINLVVNREKTPAVSR